MNKRMFHRVSGAVLGAFLLLHLVNHFFIFDSVSAHIQFMEKARWVYRQPVVEAVLLLAVITQIISGILLFKKKKSRTVVDKLQKVSGLSLSIFLLNHVAAVLYARVFLNLDSNLYFAIAGMHTGLWVWFFAPYYLLFVVALVTHIACFVFARSKPQVVISISFITMIIALFMVLAMLGCFYQINIPEAYQSIYPRVT